MYTILWTDWQHFLLRQQTSFRKLHRIVLSHSVISYEIKEIVWKCSKLLVRNNLNKNESHPGFHIYFWIRVLQHKISDIEAALVLVFDLNVFDRISFEVESQTMRHKTSCFFHAKCLNNIFHSLLCIKISICTGPKVFRIRIRLKWFEQL